MSGSTSDIKPLNMQPIQSLRSRVGSIFRRGSMSSKDNKDDHQSGNESSRPPSPSPRKASLGGAGDTGSLRLKKKRLSLSNFGRGRSGTNDTLEHSQIAQQVYAEVKAGEQQKVAQESDKPEPATTAAATSVDATTDDTKVEESPVDEAKAAENVQDGEYKYEEPVAVPAEEPVAMIEQVVAPSFPVPAPAPAPEEAPIVTHEVDTHVPTPSMWGVHSRVGGLGESYHVVMQEESPNHSTTNVADIAPSFPEPAPYETSFSSSASGASPDVSYTSPAPLTMPVPYATGERQPLSAIDENAAKVHPLAEQVQSQTLSKDKQRAEEPTATTVQQPSQPPKEDVNYDADEYVRVMSLFFLLPAVLFLGIPYFFPHQILEFASL